MIEKYFLWSISSHVGRRDSWPIISLRWLLANQNSQGCHPFNKVQRRCPYCIQVLLPENEGQCLHHCRQGICLTDWGWYLFHETLTTEPWGADYYSNNRFPAVYRMHMLETPTNRGINKSGRGISGITLEEKQGRNPQESTFPCSWRYFIDS